MKTGISCAVFGIVLLLALTTPAAAGSPPGLAASVKPEVESPDLVQAALSAEAAGNRELRRELVRDAIEKQPESALAHWCAGEVRQNGRWLTLDEAQRQAAADPRLAEYRKLRDKQDGTAAGQFTLASWCRDQGLLAESRVHWMQVLMDQPENEEALKALGARWYQGQLLTDAQIKEAGRRQYSLPTVSPQSIERWASPVAKWRTAFKQREVDAGESVRTEIAAIGSPREVYALGSLLMNRSRRKSDPKGYLLVSLALIDSLDYRGEPWAVKQLAWHAVEHPTVEVRDAAADALKTRPKESYVPWLLSFMQTPIEACIVVTPSPDGVGVAIYQIFEREGPDAIYRDVRQGYYTAGTPRVKIATNTIVKPKTNTRSPTLERSRMVETNIPQIVQESWRDAENYATTTRNQVERVNANIEDLNQRIQDAINRATGETMDANPSSWQRWWVKYCCDHYELEPTLTDQANVSSGSYPYAYDQPQPGSKPVIERYQTVGAPTAVVVTHVNYGSCFPSNTNVWTSTGAVEIGKIKPGDLVLSQEPYTGELSYQPVLQVTRRKPSPMIEIGLGSESIRATRGHPFWVCGEGWKMAKQLAVGMWLHGIDGPVLIDRIDQLPAADSVDAQPDATLRDVWSYNLVLEECHNYFVGQQKILVHDNTLFPLDGPVPAVPGLVASKPMARSNPAGK
ncbi:MAG: hypothetical protein GX616_03770 [Planctomycetes bacterium]|nr:hypothetical protein [Planctomycetota bacterium]